MSAAPRPHAPRSFCCTTADAPAPRARFTLRTSAAWEAAAAIALLCHAPSPRSAATTRAHYPSLVVGSRLATWHATGAEAGDDAWRCGAKSRPHVEQQ